MIFWKAGLRFYQKSIKAWNSISQLTDFLLPFYSLTILANTAAPWEKCLEYDVEFKGLKINISVQCPERKAFV